MPKFQIKGANKHTGKDQIQTTIAEDESHARTIAQLHNIIVEEITQIEPIPSPTIDPIQQTATLIELNQKAIIYLESIDWHLKWLSYIYAIIPVFIFIAALIIGIITLFGVHH